MPTHMFMSKEEDDKENERVLGKKQLEIFNMKEAELIKRMQSQKRQDDQKKRMAAYPEKWDLNNFTKLEDNKGFSDKIPS